jgi:hypothetical protein
VNGERWFRFDTATNTAHLTQLFKWYGGDFAQVFGSPLEFVARYSPEMKQSLEGGQKPEIVWMEYDWSLNSQANAK